MKVARFDEKIRSLLMSGKLAIIYDTTRGQELVTSAMMAALNQDEYLVTSYSGQHSDMREAWFAHVPGLKIVTRSNAADAKVLPRRPIAGLINRPLATVPA